MPPKKVVMDKADYVAEHKRLIKLLGDTSEALAKEKKTQEAEPELKGSGTKPNTGQHPSRLERYRIEMEVPTHILSTIGRDWDYVIDTMLPIDEQEFPTFGWSVSGFDPGSKKAIVGKLRWDHIDKRLLFEPNRRDAPGMSAAEKAANDYYQDIEVDFLDNLKKKFYGPGISYNSANAAAIVIDRINPPNRKNAILYSGVSNERRMGDSESRPYYTSISSKSHTKAL